MVGLFSLFKVAYSLFKSVRVECSRNVMKSLQTYHRKTARSGTRVVQQVNQVQLHILIFLSRQRYLCPNDSVLAADICQL